MKFLLSKVQKDAIYLGKKVLVIQIAKQPRKVQFRAGDAKYLNPE